MRRQPACRRASSPALKLRGYLALYGADLDEYAFYRFLTPDGSAYAVGLMKYGDFLFYGDLPGDPGGESLYRSLSEAASFLLAQPALRRISAAGPFGGLLENALKTDFQKQSGSIFRLGDPAAVKTEQRSPGCFETTEYQTVYGILQAAFPADAFPQAGYPLWLCEQSHAVRHGWSKVYLLEGKATATVLFQDAASAVIGQAAVLPDARGKGLGRAVIAAAISHLLDECKDVYLYSADQSTDGFYRKIGFLPAGEWIEYRRETE